MPTRSRAQKTEDVPMDEKKVDEVAPDEGIAAGSEGLPGPAVQARGALNIWPAPGYLVVEEQNEAESGVGGDVGVGTVRIAGSDETDQYWVGLPVMYAMKTAPQLLRGQNRYAVVKTEAVLGVASWDKDLMANHIAAQRSPERMAYDPDEEMDVYRSSSQTSSPSGSQGSSAGTSPFAAWTGGS